MVHLVERNSAFEAWKAGVDLVLSNNGKVKNLLTTISRPCDIDPAWLVDRSPNRFAVGADDIRDVANTIFPSKLAARYPDREQLYRRYVYVHDRARCMGRGRGTWGTYFERLVRFPPDNVNQLERVVQKLRNWTVRNTTGLVFHLSSPAVDAPRTRGSPCWHFGEILWNEGNVLDLVVVYRNHDYFNKVLGNFIGLGRLLNFICSETGKASGSLICHSVHAYHDRTVSALRSMAE